MSTIRMSAPNTDYDAAQALLDLQGEIKQDRKSTGAYVWCDKPSDNKEEMEKEAKLFWNCFISSEVPPPPNNNHIRSLRDISDTQFSNAPISYNIPIENRPDTQYPKDSDKKRTNYVDSYRSKVSKMPRSEFGKEYQHTRNGIKTVKTWDVGTQTEERYYNPNIDLMETTIKNLYERIQSLEAQLKEPNSPMQQSAEFVSSENEEIENDISYESRDCYDKTINEDTKSTNINQFSGFLPMYGTKVMSNYQDRRSVTRNKEAIYRAVQTNRNVNNTNDLVPIGDGNAIVSSRLLKHINWNSYTSATRKLLTAVFSRRILATHSLTGKPSPAFPNKPAKKKLDPVLVNDIVQTVVERCSVPENVVRTSITTKCADESKMFRTREKNKKRRSSKKNRENIPPTTSESESEDLP